MKTKEHIPSFAWHLICEEAIYQGWDFESDIYSVFSEDSLTSVTHSLNSGQEITLKDWIEASKSNFTKEFVEFFSVVLRNMEAQEGKNLPDGHHPMLVSMHSGSSDYFTFSMLQDLVK